MLSAAAFVLLASRVLSQSARPAGLRGEVTAYIQAAATGFAAYKTGRPQMFSGHRVWDSKVSPMAAKRCWVIEGATNTLSCLLYSSTDPSLARYYYMLVAQGMLEYLPQDWKPDPAPPFTGDLPSKAFRSPSGVHGEVWISRAASGGAYELHCEIVAAPRSPH